MATVGSSILKSSSSNSEILGTPTFFESEKVTIASGGVVNMLTINIGAQEIYNLSQFYCSCSIPGKITVKNSGTLIASGRTQPGKPDIHFKWLPVRAIGGAGTIVVEFETISGPAVCVEFYLHTGKQ